MSETDDSDWRSKNLTERLAYSYTEELFTDVDIVVHLEGQNHHFRAHRDILAHFSPALQTKLHGKETSTVHIKSVDPQGLSYLLRYIYYVPTNCTDRSIVVSAYHAARQLDMNIIEGELRQQIYRDVLTTSLVTEDDFWKILELSLILKLTDVVDELLVFAEQNTKEILKSRSAAKATASTVIKVLDLNSLNVPEIDVLECVDRWIEENASMPFVDDFCKDMLSRVRFQSLSHEEFCQFISKRSDVISNGDIVKIFMNLTIPATIPLPPWCSTQLRVPAGTLPKDDLIQSETGVSCEDIASVPNRPRHLLQLLADENKCDVCFLVGEDGTPVKAHRSVLAIGSRVFERMFFGSLADTRDSIQISTQYPEGFKTMIRYFYCDSDLDDVFLLNDLLATQTLDSALKYGSITLIKRCLQCSGPNYRKLRMFWKALESKSKQTLPKDESVKELSEYAMRNTRQILECVDFLTATLESVSWVLSLRFRGVKEIHLLYKLSEWAEHNLGIFKSDATRHKLLSSIRFEDITSEQFISFLEIHRCLLPLSESLEILMHLVYRSYPLPTWFSKGRLNYERSGSSQHKRQLKIHRRRNSC